MDQKLVKLYEECVQELKSIGINFENFGITNISLAKRNAKRYGCCKQSNPDDKCYHYVYRNHRRIKVYDKFLKHNIEISKWVMDLDDSIIKNTIMHEMIHCMPYCNNHGQEFKTYAKFINKNLGYEIKRLGNKEEDYKKSNIEFKEKLEPKYKIRCKECGIIFYRQRLKKNFIKNYRCGICKGKLELIEQKI